MLAAMTVLILAACRAVPGPPAMPGLHAGWPRWRGYAVWSALRARHPRRALLPRLFPLLMAAGVAATANRYGPGVTGSIVLLAPSAAAVSAGDRLAVRRRQARPRRPART